MNANHSAWSVPACSACKGEGSSPVDGSECGACEGCGIDYYSATSAADRGEVAKQFVGNYGALVAMTAAGFTLRLSDPMARTQLDLARAEWGTVYRDAFGCDASTKVGAGRALWQAMRDAVAEAAVQFAVESADDESEIDAMDLDAVKAARSAA